MEIPKRIFQCQEALCLCLPVSNQIWSNMWLSPARRFKCRGRTEFSVDIDMVLLFADSSAREYNDKEEMVILQASFG